MKIMLLASINLLATHSLREDEDSLVSGFFHPLPSIQDPNDEVFDSLFFRNLSSDDYSPPSTDSGPPSLQAQDGPLPTPAQTRKIAQSIQDAIQDTHPPAAPNDLTAVSDTNEWSWEWISHQNHGHTQKHIHDFQGITISGPPSLQAQDGPLPIPAQTRKIAQSIQDAIQDTHPPAAPNDLTAVSDTNEWSWEWISHQNHGHTQKHIHDFQGITIHDRILAENMLLHQK